MLSLFASTPHNLITLHNTTEAVILYSAAFSVGALIAAIVVAVDCLKRSSETSES
jgi:hypothetical protein